LFFSAVLVLHGPLLCPPVTAVRYFHLPLAFQPPSSTREAPLEGRIEPKTSNLAEDFLPPVLYPFYVEGLPMYWDRKSYDSVLFAPLPSPRTFVRFFKRVEFPGRPSARAGRSAPFAPRDPDRLPCSRRSRCGVRTLSHRRKQAIFFSRPSVLLFNLAGLTVGPPVLTLPGARLVFRVKFLARAFFSRGFFSDLGLLVPGGGRLLAFFPL